MLTELHPLVDQRHGQAGGAAGQRSPGHGGAAVAVPVRLDHRAELGRCGQAGQHPGVVGHRAQVDLGPGRTRATLGHGDLVLVGDHEPQPHRGAVSHRPGCRPPSRPWRVRRPPAPAGRRPPALGRPRAAARPWTCAPSAAASVRRDAAGAEGADDPREDVTAARRRQGRDAGRREQDVGRPASWCGHRRQRALQQHDRSRRPARLRAAARRSSPGGAPASRAYSPSWGVRMLGALRFCSRVRAASLVAERSQPVGVDHQRDGDGGDHRPDLLGRGIRRAETRADHHGLALGRRFEEGARPTLGRQAHADGFGGPGRRGVTGGAQADHARRPAAMAPRVQSTAEPSMPGEPAATPTACTHLLPSRDRGAAAPRCRRPPSPWPAASGSRCRCPPPRPAAHARTAALEQTRLEGGEGHRVVGPHRTGPASPLSASTPEGMSMARTAASAGTAGAS